MAEFADKFLEELVPVFEQLKRHEIFTETEVRLVIKKCKAFEYKLQRRVKDKHDYVKYSQYLAYFLALIRTRRIEMDFWQLRAEIDRAVAYKIDSLLKRACYRYQDDVKLWLTRINFLKQKKANYAVSKAYLRMLQVHGNAAANWILAAKFEFEENSSVENARSLLQRGIRFLASSQALWIELFRLELLYVEKLKKRQEIFSKRNNNVESSMSIVVDTVTHGDDAAGVPPSAPSDDEDGVKDALMNLDLVRVVMTEAMDQFDDPAFCAKLLSVAGLFRFAGELKEEITDHIRERFGENEDAWKCLAEMEDYPKSIEKFREATQLLPTDYPKSIEKFREATQLLPTAKMFRYFIDYLFKTIETPIASTDIEDTHAQLMQTLADANDRLFLSESHYILWINQCSAQEEAESVMQQGLTIFPKSVSIWQFKIAMFLQNCHTPKSAKSVVQLLEECTEKLPEAECLPVWMPVLRWLAAHNQKQLLATLEKGIKAHGNVANPARLFYLNYVFHTDGVAAGRVLFSRLAMMRPNSLHFYEQYIKLELTSQNQDSHYIRQAYELAVLDHGATNADLWLDFIRFEMQPELGRLDKVAGLYDRAMKNLDKEQLNTFMIKYASLK